MGHSVTPACWSRALSAISETTSPSIQFSHRHWLPDPWGPPSCCYVSTPLTFFSPRDFLGESRGSRFGYAVREQRVGESLQGHLCLEAVLLAFSPPLSSWLPNGKRGLCSYDPGERPTLHAEAAEASSSGSDGESCFARKALCSSACLFLTVSLQLCVYFCLHRDNMHYSSALVLV